MSSSRALGLILLLAVVLVARAPGVAAAKSRCVTKPGATVERSTTLVLVWTSKAFNTYVCFKPTGRTVHISENEDEGTSAYFADVEDRFVAYEHWVNGRDDVSITMRVLNAKTGRVVSRAEAFRGSQFLSGVTRVSDGVDSVDVDVAGNVAWIYKPLPDQEHVEVRFKQRRQPVQVLSTEQDVVPDSIALGQRHVYWDAASGPHAWRRP